MRRKTARFGIALVGLNLLVAVGCGDDGMGGMGGMGGTNGMGDARGMAGAGGAGAPMDTRAIVAATDYMNPGQLFSINLDNRTASPVGNTGEDPVLRSFGGKVLLINRFGATNADNVQPLDTTSFMGPQYSTGNGSNPYDVACVSLTKCYIAAYGLGSVPIMNLETGQMTGSVDLGSLDPDGIPQTDALFLEGTTLFVSIQRLDPSFMPRGVGRVVTIDTTNDTMTGSIDLATSNPVGWFVKRPGHPEICLVTSGDFSGTQGGIECINTSTKAATGFVAQSQMLGGYIGGWTFSTDGARGWAAVNKAFPNSELWEFDASNGMPIRRIGTSNSVTDVALNSRGELYATDLTMNASGLRVYRADTGQELTTTPIALGMLPPAFTGGILFLTQ